MLNYISFEFGPWLEFLGNVSANNIFSAVKMSCGLRSLREVLAVVIFSNEVPMALEFFATVNFFLLKSVRQMLPLASKRCSFANLTFLERVCVQVSGANNNGSIIVTEVLFALNIV